MSEYFVGNVFKKKIYMEYHDMQRGIGLTSSPDFLKKSWDFYTFRSVGIGNNFMLILNF